MRTIREGVREEAVWTAHSRLKCDFGILANHPTTNRQPQEYNYHLGPVNTVTFLDPPSGTRFVTTSDDKTIRMWEFGIPVQVCCCESIGQRVLNGGGGGWLV